MYIGREDWENILSYADFTRLCNFIGKFTELNIDILKEGITSPLSYSVRTCNRRKFVLLVCRNIEPN